jgi:serine/threonine-protein kinase
MTLPPQKLGKYEIRRELGSGAMGVVYEGWDPGIGRRVAIKTIKRDQLERSEAGDVLARFQREAQAAGRLSHPNIVAIYEYGEAEDGTVFIAMEFIEGRELKDYFDANERFPLTEIGRIMKELLAALGHAHQHGVVHRDIKPANVILLKDGTVKVADFGIARIESSNLTQAGAVLGTPAYMSPEQFMGQTIDGRSDLFSAGVLLYQLLTGDKPFTGTLTTIMHKVLKEEPPAPSELNVQAPRQFDALVRRALAKRPEERFQTAQEFAAAIEGALQGKKTIFDEATLVAGATSTGTIATIGTVSPATPATQVPPPPPVLTGRRMPLALALAGAAVLAAGGAFVALKGGGTAAPVASEGGQGAVSPAPTFSQAADGSTLTITAVGFADPSDARYAQDQGLLQADLREDVRRQLVEKAAALYIDQGSLQQHYGLIQAKLLANNASFIQAMREERAPQQGKDGLVSITARASVNVREVQKSLNQMSREERVEFIRNNGDPKISVAIAAKSAAGDQNVAAPRSPVAENLLKERIQSFGFRLVNEDPGAAGAADFAVTGEAKFKKLSHTLEASGVTIEKFALTSWTVKCTDKKSGEEIYYNTQIPEKQSWATEDQALRDIGKLIGEEFSKNFFLQHFHQTARKVKLRLQGLPGGETAQTLLREMTGLRPVLGIALARADGKEALYDAELSGGLADAADLVGKGIAAPLNHKLGKACLSVAGMNGNEVTLAFAAACDTPETMARLDALPAAALLTAPPPRREALTRNPETLRKLSI